MFRAVSQVTELAEQKPGIQVLDLASGLPPNTRFQDLLIDDTS